MRGSPQAGPHGAGRDHTRGGGGGSLAVLAGDAGEVLNHEVKVRFLELQLVLQKRWAAGRALGTGRLTGATGARERDRRAGDRAPSTSSSKFLMCSLDISSFSARTSSECACFS